MADLKKEASDLELVDATVRRLGSVLHEFKDFYALTPESPCLQDQARLLHINDADKQLLKIPTYVNTLRARLAQTVTSIHAATAAREKKEVAAQKMMAAARKMMAQAEKTEAAADRKMKEADKREEQAGMMWHEVNGLMEVAQKKTAAAERQFETAVIFERQADMALAAIEQNKSRWGDLRRVSTRAVGTMRQSLAGKRLQMIKMDAEIARRREPNRNQRVYLDGDNTTQMLKNTAGFKEILENRYHEVRVKLIQTRKTWLTMCSCSRRLIQSTVPKKQRWRRQGRPMRQSRRKTIALATSGHISSLGPRKMKDATVVNVISSQRIIQARCSLEIA